MNLSKRFFAVLITALLLVSCHVSAESAEYDEWPKLIQVLQDAGRETGNILASEVYPMDTPETAVFLVQAGDTAQLTVLEAEKNGAWQITGQNDTIPVSICDLLIKPVFPDAIRTIQQVIGAAALPGLIKRNVAHHTQDPFTRL